jgi:aryl-alcohol dehydrogenase-like predicted oxidoreductase
MLYRQLGRTGVQVTPLCLGGMLFGGRTPEEEAITIIDTALDAGIKSDRASTGTQWQTQPYRAG